MKNVVLALSIVLVGCVTTSHVLELGHGTYSITSTGDGFSSASRTREKAFKEGSDYCAKLGKHFQLESEAAPQPTRMGIDTSVSITFSCSN